MATQLEIRINGQPLDLKSGEDLGFYVTKQIYDLNNLETRNAGNAKSITIPKTPNNLAILGNNLPSKGRFDEAPWIQLECDIIISGVPVMDDAFLLITSEDDTTLKAGIFGGTASFFVSLKNDDISQLTWSDLDLEWTTAGALAIGTNTTGVTIADSLWYTNQARRLYEAIGGVDINTQLDKPELGEMGLWLYCKEILDRIFASLDEFEILYDFDTSALAKLALPLSVPVIHESFARVDGTFQTVATIDFDFTLLSNFDLIEYNIINPPLPGDPVTWNAGLNRWDFAEAGFYVINSHFAGTQRDNDGCNFQLWKNSTDPNLNGVGLAVTPSFSTAGGPLQNFEVAYSTTFYAIPGDYLQNYSKGTSNATVRNLNDANFNVQRQGAGRGTTVSISSILPTITQRQFVKEIFKYYNIYAVETAKVVKLKLFEQISKDTAIEISLDKSREFKVGTAIVNYGITNHLKFTENSLVERADMDDFFPVNSQTLARDVDKIILLFTATDICDKLSNENNTQLRCSIPKYQMIWSLVDDNKMQIFNNDVGYTTTSRNDILPGDFISLDNGGVIYKRRVVAVIDDFNGLVQDPWPATLSEKDWNHWTYTAIPEPGLQIARLELSANPWEFQNEDINTPVPGGFYATFADLELWSQRKITYYKLLTDSVYKPFLLVAWARIPVTEFAVINEDDPIYIEEFDSYFYLNKLEQWRRDGMCRLELVELNI